MTSNGRRRRESSSESESNSHQPVADKRLTICVIGSGAVGKSSLTVRYLQGHFPEVSNTKTQICSGHACSMLVGAGDNCCQIVIVVSRSYLSTVRLRFTVGCSSGWIADRRILRTVNSFVVCLCVSKPQHCVTCTWHLGLACIHVGIECCHFLHENFSWEAHFPQAGLAYPALVACLLPVHRVNHNRIHCCTQHSASIYTKACLFCKVIQCGFICWHVWVSTVSHFTVEFIYLLHILFSSFLQFYDPTVGKCYTYIYTLHNYVQVHVDSIMIVCSLLAASLRMFSVFK